LRAVIGRMNFKNGLVLGTVCMGLAACGSSTKTADIPSGKPGEQTATSAPIPEKTTAAPSLGKPTAAITALADGAGKDTTKKPKIAKPKGGAPAKLVIVDLVDGTGPAAKSGDQLTADYAGNSWSTGKEFDSSWGKGKSPFTVALGQGAVIQGWDQGLVGMKKGGRRMLVIPADLAYGPSGRPPTIGPNETLVFVIDLRKIG
jgi:peptidylprolyl isomerase